MRRTIRGFAALSVLRSPTGGQSGPHGYRHEGRQCWIFPAKGRLLISGLTWDCRPDDKNDHADNGVYGLSLPSQVGLPAVVRGDCRAWGKAFPLREYAKGRLFGQAFWEAETTDLVFRGIASNELPSHGFGSWQRAGIHRAAG